MIAAPVGPLETDEPVVAPLGFGDAAADGQGHGGFDVVPRIGVIAGRPRDHPRGQLPFGDGIDGEAHVGGSEDPVDLRRADVAHDGDSGLRA